MARNAGFTLVGRVWYVVIWFAVTPFVLGSLGPERFGVWSLLFLLSGYLTTFDLGLGTSVVRFTAQCATEENWAGLRSILGQVSRVYLLLGVVWVLAIFLLLPWILSWLGVSPDYEAEVRVAILASAVIFAVANLVSTGPAVLNGLQRMELSNGILVVASLPQLVVLLGGLSLGYGLYAVVASTAVQWLGVAVGAFFLLRRHAPAVHWPNFRVGEDRARWFGFSASMQLNNVLALTNQQVDKIVLVMTVGLSAVTEFELGFRVANGIQSLPVLAMAPLLPAFSELHAGGDRSRFDYLWQRGTNLLTAGAFGLAAATIPVAWLLVRAWVGPGHQVAETLAAWLLAGFAINLCTGAVTAAARGSGRPDLEFIPATAAIVAHVIASRLLIDTQGPVGIGPAFLLAMILWVGLYLVGFARWAKASVWRLVVSIFARPVLALVPSLLLGLWAVQLLPPAWLEGRAGLVLGAVIGAIAAGGVFAILWWLLGRIGWMVNETEFGDSR